MRDTNGPGVDCSSRDSKTGMRCILNPDHPGKHTAYIGDGNHTLAVTWGQVLPRASELEDAQKIFH